MVKNLAMKHLQFILFALLTLNLGAQNLETDTTIIVSGVEVNKSQAIIQTGIVFDTVSVDSFGFAEVTDRQLFDTISIDSLSIKTRLEIEAQIDADIESIDRKIKRLRDKRVPLLDRRTDERRLIRKTRRKSDGKAKGFRSTLTVTFEADEAPTGVEMNKSDALKSILIDREYKNAKAIADTYRTAAELKRVAVELGIKPKGNKSAVAQQIFDFINQ